MQKPNEKCSHCNGTGMVSDFLGYSESPCHCRRAVPWQAPPLGNYPPLPMPAHRPYIDDNGNVLAHGGYSAEQLMLYVAADRAERKAAPDQLRGAANMIGAEPMTRYCPGCGSVGPVDYTKHRDCCPDGGQARMIPAALAQQCRDTFQLAIAGLLAEPASVAAADGWKLVPITVPRSAFPWVSGGYEADYKAGSPRDQKLIEDRAQRTWKNILDGISSPAPALEAPGDVVRTFRDYISVHEVSGRMNGRAMDDMALDLARIALNFKHLVKDAAPQAPAAPAVDAETIHLQDLKNALADCKALRQQLTLMDEQQAGSVWRWQADGQDHLESMGNHMGVLIRACDLRALLAGVSAPAAPAADTLDATRYRALRKGNDYKTDGPMVVLYESEIDRGDRPYWALASEAMDAAIDAAMAAKEGGAA